MSSRGPKRKIVTNEVEMKMAKIDMLLQPKVEVMDKEEKLTHHSCPICNLKLECAPGDMVMKRHYMEKHYTSGGLLEMVALDLGEGQRLRCPYPDCEVRSFFQVCSGDFFIVIVQLTAFLHLSFESSRRSMFQCFPLRWGTSP